MAYLNEKASKFNHQQIIKDKNVQAYLNKCFVPDLSTVSSTDFKSISTGFDSISDSVTSCINNIVVIDGGYQVVTVTEDFPSAQLAYFSIGILNFNKESLDNLEKQKTIDPEDVGKLKNMYKYNFVLPTKVITFKNKLFETTVRETIFNIFYDNELWNNKMVDTLKWLIFKEYNCGNGSLTIKCPNNCGKTITFSNKTKNYKDETNNFATCNCNSDTIKTTSYITDIFELHEVVDEFNGANPIVSFVMSAFETLLAITIYKTAIENKRMSALSQLLIIKDGSLALFSRLDDLVYKSIRPFLTFLYEESLKSKKSYVNWVGLDKSGMFYEHYKGIEERISDNSILLADSTYIKKYITGETNSPFGYKTYFGYKLFYKKDDSLSFVVDFPIPYKTNKGEPDDYTDFLDKPDLQNFINLKSIIEILVTLRCDLYSKSFIPVALINKMVSLSDVPSNKMLKLFSTDSLSSGC